MTTSPSSVERHRSELFNEITDIVAREVEARGLPADAAQETGTAACDAIAAAFGGAMLYIPSDYARKNAARDAELLRRFSTESAADLARELGLSIQTIYKSIRRAQARQGAQS